MSQHRLGYWVLASVAVLALAAGAARAGEHGCTGECYEPVPPKVVHKSLKYRYVTERGAYSIAREPSLYGWAKRPVLAWHDDEYETVTVRRRLPARYLWEKRWIGGRYVMCKVRVPGEVVEEEAVRVRRAGFERTGEYEDKRILLRPYKNIAIYDKARHAYITGRTAVQPEGVRWRRVRKSELSD